MILKKKNIVGKGLHDEQHFSRFHKMLSSPGASQTDLVIRAIIDGSSANALGSDKTKILSSRELTNHAAF